MKTITIFLGGIIIGVSATLIIKRMQRHNGKPPVVYDNSNQIQGIKQTP